MLLIGTYWDYNLSKVPESLISLKGVLFGHGSPSALPTRAAKAPVFNWRITVLVPLGWWKVQNRRLPSQEGPQGLCHENKISPKDSLRIS